MTHDLGAQPTFEMYKKVNTVVEIIERLGSSFGDGTAQPERVQNVIAGIQNDLRILRTRVQELFSELPAFDRTELIGECKGLTQGVLTQTALLPEHRLWTDRDKPTGLSVALQSLPNELQQLSDMWRGVCDNYGRDANKVRTVAKQPHVGFAGR